MAIKFVLILTLLSVLAWEVTSLLNPNDPRYLQCHNPNEICKNVPCCNANNQTYTCQEFDPTGGDLYPGEQACLPPNSTNTTVSPLTCHGELEVCYKLGCCNPNYTCAPYQPQNADPGAPLFPCEYRCEYTPNITVVANQTAVECLANYKACNATTCPPPAPPCGGTPSLPTTTCSTTSTTTCTPPGSTANCTTTSVTDCINSADNSTTTSTTTCVTTTTGGSQ